MAEPPPCWLAGPFFNKKTTAVVVVEAEAAVVLEAEAAVVVEAEATAAVERPLESKAYLRSLKAGGPLGSGSLQ